MWKQFPAAMNQMQIWDAFQQTMNERIPTSFSNYYGEPLNSWFDVNVYPAKVGISVFFRNITKQRFDQQVLAETEEKFRMCFDLNPQVSWTMDAPGQITELGVRWQQITGLNLKESLGAGFLNAVHPDDVPRIINYLAATVPAKLPIDIEFRVLRRDMRFIWMRGRGTPVLNDDGTINRYYGSTEDIDELEELREALSLLQTSTRFN